MQTAAIIGAGLIGRAWAIVFARAGWQVKLHDPAAAAREAAPRLIAKQADMLLPYGLSGKAEDIVRQITVCETLAEVFAGATYVQENSPEKLDVKQALFAEMDQLADADTILASSTSGFPASAFTEGLKGRGRMLVAHPVNPPHLVPLVELSPAPWTDPDVTFRARAIMDAVGQTPITVKKEIDGFILNRLQAALVNEALRLAEGGYADMDDIDRTVRDGLGLRWSFMGPFETIDLNAPGGLADYAARYGPLLNELARQQSASPDWNGPAIAALEADRRSICEKENLPAQGMWRDQRLAALRAHKRAEDDGR